MSTTLPPVDLLPVFNAQPGATLLLSPEWVIVGASDDYLAATLTQRAAIVGQFIFDAFPDNPEAPEANAVANVRASLAQVMATGQPHEMAPQHYDVPDPAQPGRFVERHWQSRYTPVLDAAGQVQFIIQSVQDITASRLAERQLRESQASEQLARADAEQQRTELRRIFQEAPVAMGLLRGPDFVVEWANPRMGQIWGRPVAQVQSRPHFEALPDLAGQGFEQVFADVLTTGRTRTFQERLVRIGQDPQTYHGYFNITYQPVYDGPQRITGILAYAVEVTEQVRIRQQVEQFNQELETRVQERTRAALALQADLLVAAQHQADQRALLYQIFEQTPAVVALLRGPGHRFEYVNPAYQAIFPGCQLVGLDAAEVVPELAAQGFVALLDRVYQTGETYYGQELPFTPQPAPGEVPRTGYYNFTYQAYRESGAVVGVSTFAYCVTEQVLARQEREAQQRQLHDLFMQAPAPICILDGPELVYQLVNPAYQRIFSGRALLGKPLLVAMPELAGLPLLDDFQRVYDTGETFVAHELPLQLARDENGPLEEFVVTFTYQARRNAAGAVDGVLVFGYDVTEQVRARHAVEASEQQVRALVESASFPIGVYVGPDLRIQLANEALLTAWGKGPNVLGQRVADVLPELVGQAIFQHLQQVLTTGEALHLRNERVDLLIDGRLQPYYYNYSFTPLRDAQGQVHGVLNTAADVTDLAQARLRLEAYAAELQESEARFRTMADAAPNLVWAANPDSSVRYLNRAFLDFVGLRTEEEYIATGWRTYIHPNEFDLTQHTLSEAIAQRISFVLELRMLRHDGQFRWMLAQGAPSYLAGGELYGYVGSAIDITELKQANEQLTRTNQDLDNFVYAASHDLKQPVNNLAGLLLELQRSVVFAEPSEEQLLVPMVREALQQLGNTIDDLATLGEAQQTSLAPTERVSLDDLTEEVINTLEPQVRAARARITTDFTSWPVLVFPRANLRTILLNLLGNSLKYADPARPARIHVSVWAEQGCPVLVVEDNGLGFDADKHGAELFQLFRRLHTHTPGTGVGLYLVHRIVEATGGTIAVDSQPGEGATFRIRFGRG